MTSRLYDTPQNGVQEYSNHSMSKLNKSFTNLIERNQKLARGRLTSGIDAKSIKLHPSRYLDHCARNCKSFHCGAALPLSRREKDYIFLSFFNDFHHITITYYTLHSYIHHSTPPRVDVAAFD